MAVEMEYGPSGEGFQSIRTVVDAIDNCNLGCHYCHPMMGGWGGDTLAADQVGDLLDAGESMALLEETITGGEITMHPEFEGIMQGTHRLGNTALSFVTNATRITPDIVTKIADSRTDRVCVSLDGPDAESHNSRRGRNFDKVMEGLRALQDTGKPITVISVVHKQNAHAVTRLSEMLADRDLADQHHLCAPSYSGQAKRHYGKLALEMADFYAVQGAVDAVHADLAAAGVYTTFNSFWPATGERGASAEPRTMTLIQYTEQVKDIYGIVRPNGDVRATAAAWGRETVGNAVVGNLNQEDAATLLGRVDRMYRAGVQQLPRAVEAAHKFHVGPYAAAFAETNDLLASEDPSGDESLHWQPARPLAEIDLLDNPFGEDLLRDLARRIVNQPHDWRFLRHASGVDIAYNRSTAHLTVLKPDETARLNQIHDELTGTTAVR